MNPLLSRSVLIESQNSWSLITAVLSGLSAFDQIVVIPFQNLKLRAVPHSAVGVEDLTKKKILVTVGLTSFYNKNANCNRS